MFLPSEILEKLINVIRVLQVTTHYQPNYDGCYTISRNEIDAYKSVWLLYNGFINYIRDLFSAKSYIDSQQTLCLGSNGIFPWATTS